MNEKKKPVNTVSGWHFKSEYIDNEGNVFNKGVYNKEATAKLKEERIKEEVALLKEENISKDDIDNETDLLKKDIEKQNKTIEFLLERLQAIEKRETKDNFDYGKFASIIKSKENNIPSYDYKQTPTDDIAEKEVLFTTYGVGCCFIDKRDINGFIQKTPYNNLIEFKSIGHKSTKLGREKQTSHVCGYKTKLKSEIDWFRTHPHYGILIFEDVGTVLDTDIEYMKAVAEEFKVVSNMSQQQLISNAKHYDIKLGGSLDNVKNQIAFKRAKNKIEEMKSKVQELIRRNSEIVEFMDKV